MLRLVGALALVALPLVAQVRIPNAVTLVGMARDSAGIPIPNVEVWIRGTDLYTHTNEVGGFRFPGAPEGSVKLTMRRIGFEQATVDLELKAGRIDSLVVAMTAAATRIAGMNVEAEAMTRSKRLLAGFWDRRAMGIGHYVTRDEIAAKDAHDFTDIVRMLPGVQILTVNGRKQVRFSRSMGGRGDCPPLFFVDGMRLENATSEEFPPGDVEGVEVYNGPATTPPQFTPRTVQMQKTCGVIVVWTRLPGTN